MDFNNKAAGKRSVQSIQDMINSAPSGSSRIGKSGYSGPKSIPRQSSELQMGSSYRSNSSGINVTNSDATDRWGNSSSGMPEARKPRVRSDVANPMRGNILKKQTEEDIRERGGHRSFYDDEFGDTRRERSSDRSSSRRSSERSLSRTQSRHRDEVPLRKPKDAGGLKIKSSYVAPQAEGILDDYGWIIFSGILVFCVFITLIASGVKPRGGGYKYPINVYTITGVVNSSYEHLTGMSASNYSAEADSQGDSNDSQGDGSDAYDLSGGNDNTKEVTALGANDLTSLGDEAEAVALDDGSGNVSGISQATSHSELVGQVKDALASNNYSIVAAKLCYADENTGELHGYPLSVVKLFSEYMSTNSSKLDAFINQISSDEYSAQNGSAYVVKLPIMKFTVKMGESTDTFVLDNTVVSVTGFSDQIVSGNQNAAIYPLLPCMYTLTLTNNAWPTPSQSQEIEATLGEGNLDIKVGY